MKKDENEIYSISIRVKNEEKLMVEKLKEEYSVNISQLFKKLIREYYEKVSQLPK